MRNARWNVSGVSYHLIWRFVDRSWFFTADTERRKYLRLLGNAFGATDWKLLAYALMSNHIHVHAVAGRLPMSSWTKRVNSPFVRWMNKRHDRLGGMMADRARDYAVLPENEGAVIAYIHNNPVRAGIAADAAGSSWTSHRAYLGLDEAPPWLNIDEGFSRARVGTPEAFEQLVRDGASVGRAELMTLGNAKSRGALVMATPVSTVAASVVARPFASIRHDPRRVVRIVADELGLSLTDVCSRRRSPAIVSAHRIVAHVGRWLGFAASNIAASLGMSPQGVGHAMLRELTPFERASAQNAVERLEFESQRLMSKASLASM